MTGRDDALSPAKRALLEIRTLKARVRELEERNQPIAIVGMGCRFPGGATDPDELWRLLMSHQDAIVEVPPDRWDADRYYDPDPAAPGRMSTRWGGFIDGVDRFDAAFFGISPREAQRMDPQQRLLLEVAWEALEHAGIAPDGLTGTRAGVFVGIAALDHVHDLLNEPASELDAYVPQAMAHSAASGRIAYALGLQGPALSIDTACSSSLAAVHLAIQSLRRGESTLALAGGVNVLRYPQVLVAMSKAGMMAADGRCKAFDDRGDGFVRAEGCGVVVLKLLDDAIRSGDRILALIHGSAMNQDGRSSGLTAPNRVAQETVLRAALADARMDANEVGYVEAHGTGTALGDPIEVGALANVLADSRTRPLPIGSIKSNLGHLEAAAGVAGLMKAALVLHHGRIPPTLHVERPNTRIPWAEIPIEVSSAARRLDGRAAGVSSFGFTGTNVHVVLGAAPDPATPSRRRAGARVIKLSARSDAALRRLAAKWAELLREPNVDFAGACRTANAGRADLPERLALVAADAAEAAEALETWLRGEPCEAVFTGHARGAGEDEVTFLFTGHGSQYTRMGLALDEAFPIFRDALNACDAALSKHLDLPLRDILADAAALDTMRLAQPALFALGYALAKLWNSWGVRPTIVLGHSVGEYAAACLAGVLSLEDAATLVCARGRLMDSLEETGRMAALFTTEDVVARALDGSTDVSIGAINGPTEVVISGRAAAIETVLARVAAEGVEFRRLAVAGAAHSPLLDPILDAFEAVARSVSYGEPSLALISGKTGAVAGPEVRTAEYWRRHLREPVRFLDALRAARAEGSRLFVDIGPHPTLAGLGRRAFADDDAVWAPSLRDGRDERTQLLEGVAALWAGGGRVDWTRIEADLAGAEGAPARVITAPTYPWEHRTFARPPAGATRAGAPDAWPAALSAGGRAQHNGPLDFHPDVFPARWATLERLALEIIADTMHTMGGLQRADERVTPAELAAGIGVRDGYRGLLHRWLDRLADAGRLVRDSAAYRVVQPVTAVKLTEARAEAHRLLSGDGEFLAEYVDRCAAALPDVLRGRAEPLETLFPDGSNATADMLYRDWSLVRYLAEVQRAATEAFARRRAPAGGLRLLEVGAGTGGTTAMLLPTLDDVLAEYAFTDVSPLFLDRAAERFRAYPSLRLGTLDLDVDPEPQGWGAGRFDLVIASNVLHATKDLPATLARIRRLLAPGGALIALEITRYLAWYDVTTALLEGWDRADDSLRRTHAMLDEAAWMDALRAAGFDRVAALPDASAPTHELGFHVLLACAPLDAPIVPAGDSPAHTAEPAQSEPETTGLRQELLAAHPHEREERLVELVRRQIAALLRLPADEPIHRRRRLMELGLDSLMAVELRSRLNAALELDEPLPSTLVFDFPTIDAIVGLLASRLGDPVSRPAVPAGGIEALSEQEAEQRLLRALDALEDS